MTSATRVEGNRPLRIFVGCEASGCVRRAFARLGHNVISCDIRPATDGAPSWMSGCQSYPDIGAHHTGDMFEFLDRSTVGYFDLAVYHTPCTFILNSGVRWLYRGGQKYRGLDIDRWSQMRGGADFFRRAYEHKAAKKAACENPQMCGAAQKIVGYKWAQHFQPWQFGVEEVKAIYMWLRDLPPIEIDPKWSVGPAPKEGEPEYGKWARVHYTSPGADRGIERSAFYDAIADQFALQWAGDARVIRERAA